MQKDVSVLVSSQRISRLERRDLPFLTIHYQTTVAPSAASCESDQGRWHGPDRQHRSSLVGVRLKHGPRCVLPKIASNGDRRLTDKGQTMQGRYAPILSSGGYSSEALAYLTGLYRHTHVRRNQLKALQHGDLVSESYLQGLDRESLTVLKEYYADEGDVNRRIAAQSISVCHSEPGGWSLPKPLYMTSTCPPPGAAYKIGRTMFETDTLTQEHVRRCNAMDEVWVPTAFNAASFAAAGVDPSKIFVLPQGVDTEVFDPTRVEKTRIFPSGEVLLSSETSFAIAGCYKFLSIFKWEKRKGWSILLDAYLSEFDGTDRVSLHILTQLDPESLARKELDSYLKQKQLLHPNKNWPHVVLITEQMTQKKLLSLYRTVDAFVLPSRGEGWGRPHMEAMAMELPVIATNWSGPTAFLSPTVGYLLDIDNLEEIEEGFMSGHKWAMPSVTHLRTLMRHLYLHPEEGKQKGRLARSHILENFSVRSCAQALLQHIQRATSAARSKLLKEEL